MDSTKPIKKEPFEDSPSTQDPLPRPESGGLKMTPKDTDSKDFKTEHVASTYLGTSLKPRSDRKKAA